MQNYPDYILIPYQVIADENIEPLAEKLYGLIYWYHSMTLRSCRVSNEELGRLLKTSPRTIQNSLNALEMHGYIKRTYKDTKKRHRKEIIPLISFRKQSEMVVTQESQSETTVTQSETTVTLERNGGDQNSNTNNIYNSNNIYMSEGARAPTPKEFSLFFFDEVLKLVNKQETSAEIIELLKEIRERHGMDKTYFWNQIKEFCAYWNEKNASGTKRKWEMQKTFEVSRRLTTWLNKASQGAYGGNHFIKQKGKTILS